MKWVTRERPKIDRLACPWLIRRFIDPEAEIALTTRNCSRPPSPFMTLYTPGAARSAANATAGTQRDS